ncbi:MAG: hypothetical protein AAF502_06415 [Bacteroidota bacterium]
MVIRCFLFIVLITLSSLSFGQKSLYEKNCDQSVLFGKVPICLPAIDGMREAYNYPTVKAFADKYEIDDNSVLAFYLENEAYQQKDQIDQLILNNYFKIYVVNQTLGVKADQRILDEVTRLLEQNYLAENWDQALNKINDESVAEFMPDEAPVTLEIYSPLDNVKSQIFLIKYPVGNSEFIMINTLNFMLIRERLVLMSFHSIYESEDSIKAARARSDAIVSKIMAIN